MDSNDCPQETISISNFDIETKDICFANYNTRYWSMEKLAWSTFKGPTLPTNFSMISGCGLALERSKALLIGGNKNIKICHNDLPIHPNKYAPNDQVLMYDSVRQSWTWMKSIPFHSIWPLELKCSIVFNKSFKT